MYDPERGWSGSARLDGTAYSSEVHSVAVNDNGTAVAAWTVVQNGLEHPMAAVYLAGEGWQSGAALGSEPASTIYAVDVAVSSDGEAVAAWDATVNGAYVVMASVYAPAAGWGLGERLIDSTNYQGDPMAGISYLGTSLVAWRERQENPDHTYTGILRNSRHDAGGWSALSRINDDDADHGAPVAHMEMNGPGQALLAYRCEVTGSSRSESRAAFFDGSSWLSSVAPSDEDDFESSCPDVGLSDDGWSMAVWASSYAVDEVTVQEADPRDEIDALRGQLNLAIVATVAAMVLAVFSLILLFRKGKKRP
jgi:hypothetical protein